MLDEINSSKEAIKNRVLKHALNYWNIKSTDHLDPVVKLILEALSSELYNLGNEIKDTQVRILEKLANLLTPDFLSVPNPAHALLHATPVEATELLTYNTNFYTHKKVSSKQNDVLDTSVDIYFTTVGNVRLFDAQVAYIASDNSLFTYDATFNKQLVARAKGKQSLSHTLWLGIRMNVRIENMHDLFFYFDWKTIESGLTRPVYQLLPLTRWYIQNMQLATTQGIPYVADPEDTHESIFSDYDLIAMIEKDIKSYYDQKFICISDNKLVNINEYKQPYPDSFKDQFSEADLQKMNEKLLWIKVVFPEGVKQEFLDGAHVYLNTFPIMNRLANSLKYRLKGSSNIIPLKTSAFEQFLSVQSLSDETREYRSVPYRKAGEEESGMYTVRTGGVERFDQRNAKELIYYLLELLRSESAAFAAYGFDFIIGTLKEMNQKIALMEQKTKGNMSSTTGIPNYIIVKPFEYNTMMYVEYWTTLAELANDIRSGSKLQQSKGAKVKQDSITLMTNTSGGKNKLRPEERIHAFRYGLMTRNRIITKEDIRSFCFYELGNKISNVEIERGFEICVQPKEAFRRTIDILITPAEDGVLENKEWDMLFEQLKARLQVRSGASNYYRIIMKERDAS